MSTDQDRGCDWSCNQDRTENGRSQGKNSKEEKWRRLDEDKVLNMGIQEDDGGKKVQGDACRFDTTNENGYGFFGPIHD